MLPKDYEIKRGDIVRHDEGLRYRVDSLSLSTDGYETTHELGGLVVGYTQLDQGDFPPGTMWSKSEEGFRAHFTLELERPRVFPQLEAKAGQVQPGQYELIDGSADSLFVVRDQIVPHSKAPNPYKPAVSGVNGIGLYIHSGPNAGAKPIVSFLYHKLDAQGNLEMDERVIILTGTGYGEHPGHAGQDPTWYLVGAQIGTIDHETGLFVRSVDNESVQPKHFSLACISDGPLGEPVLANPVQ